MKWFSSTIFALFRIILGTYLTIHFAQLLPISDELFSSKGVIKDASLLPGFNKLPILILEYDDPDTVQYFLMSLVVASVMFTTGTFRRVSALWIFYGWVSLLNRNPLISNPSLGYIGWILLACSLIPKGERLGFLQSKKDRAEYYKKYGKWEVPDIIYYGMWTIVGVSYTASGLHKLQCQTWLNGTALYYVLSGPLARQNNIIVDIILSGAALIKMMTWGSLALELSALFFGTMYRLRKSYWVMFMGFHFGILSTVNFTDLTVGMIITHLFTFDPSWFSLTKEFVRKYDWNGDDYKEFDIDHTDNFNIKSMRENIPAIVTDITHACNGHGDTNNNNIKDTDNEKNKDIVVPKEKEKSSKTECGVLSWSVYMTVIMALMFALVSKGNIYDSLARFTELTIDMYWGFGFLMAAIGFLMILERIIPDQELKYVEGWWKWVMIINAFQLFAVVLASFTWENWLQNTSYFKSTTGFHLRDHVSPLTGGLIAYIINQWLFYHWHKARHEVYFLWILFHQFHHSPSRIETITSFYKHPLEIVIDSQIMAILLYSVLGLSNESSIWLSIFSGIGEYVYHMNIKTSKILGYFFQRPESHRCHHRRNKRLHTPNYSDFPLWDILGGTFENPDEMNEETGFTSDKEIRRIDMLLFKDVITSKYQDVFSDFKKFKRTMIRYLSYFLVVWGALNAFAFIAHHDGMRDIGFVTVSSPLPLVFSAYNGVETFATAFDVTVNYQNKTSVKTSLDVNTYNLLGGAYNRRNIYGAIFSHGPFFDRENMIKIRQDILDYAVCSPGTIIDEFGIPGKVKDLHVDVLYRPELNKKIGEMYISCESLN